MSDIAKLDPARVRKIVDGFPASPDWQSLNCAELVQSARANKLKTRDWSPLNHCKEKGGVYAFIFSGDLFSARDAVPHIRLHAPMMGRVKQTITFELSTHKDLLLSDGRMVSDPVRRHRADARRDRDAGRGGAFCPPRRHDRRLYSHPPLASQGPLALIKKGLAYPLLMPEEILWQ